MCRIYECNLFKIYVTQIVKTCGLYMGVSYNWMRPIYANLQYFKIACLDIETED